jgi:hypothetical protein
MLRTLPGLLTEPPVTLVTPALALGGVPLSEHGCDEIRSETLYDFELQAVIDVASFA